MTFEKALEQCRNGKEITRDKWFKFSGAVIGIDVSEGHERVYIRHVDDSYGKKHWCHFASDDILADDWKIYNRYKSLSEQGYEVELKK